MAYDPRFAIGFIGSSGEGGAKLHRRNFGELVENVAGAGRVPLDGRQLPQVRRPADRRTTCRSTRTSWSRCARRGRCSSAAARSRSRAAGSTRRACSWPPRAPGRSTGCSARRTSATTEFPPIETALIDGDLAFRQHTGGHTAGPNWPTFLTFAEPLHQGIAPARCDRPLAAPQRQSLRSATTGSMRAARRAGR